MMMILMIPIFGFCPHTLSLFDRRIVCNNLSRMERRRRVKFRYDDMDEGDLSINLRDLKNCRFVADYGEFFRGHCHTVILWDIFTFRRYISDPLTNIQQRWEMFLILVSNTSQHSLISRMRMRKSLSCQFNGEISSRDPDPFYNTG